MLYDGLFFRGLVYSINKEMAYDSAAFCMLGLAVGLDKQPSQIHVFLSSTRSGDLWVCKNACFK